MASSPQAAAVQAEEFANLYERHSRELWAVAYARWLDSHAAMDIAQEAFLRLWKQWQLGEVVHNPRAWLLRVTRNLAEDHGKSAFRRNGTVAPQVMSLVASRQATALDALVAKERFAEVRAFLRDLPEADREILSLKYGLDRSVAEIARLLDLNVAAVHMRLSRARQRLAKRLKHHLVTS